MVVRAVSAWGTFPGVVIAAEGGILKGPPCIGILWARACDATTGRLRACQPGQSGFGWQARGVRGSCCRRVQAARWRTSQMVAAMSSTDRASSQPPSIHWNGQNRLAGW